MGMGRENMKDVKSLDAINGNENEKEPTIAVQMPQWTKPNAQGYKEWVRSLSKGKRSESWSTVDESKLKASIVHPFGEEFKSVTTDFVEYWVPVRLSDIQIELYCGSLFSNSTVLCSSYENTSLKLLHEILVSTKKCCDHPYLVDRSLHTSLTEGIPQSEQLDAQIKMSSKLLLLHKALVEIKMRGLRVLILYQSLGTSEPVYTGDVLDDIMHEKFGGDSFVRIDGHISRSKKRAALDSFNDNEGGKFVCLMEIRSCIPSIKLKAIDTVILFNSDWDPMNDLKALQKINLDSQHERVKVFRLYSTFTIEEKVLMLTKQGKTLEGHLRSIKGYTCHELLAWGAYFLFQKLHDLHSNSTTDTDYTGSKGNSFVEDVFHELSILLPNNNNSMAHTKNSLILEVQQTEGVYPSNISLVGEVEYPKMDEFSVIEELLANEPPHVFWVNIFEGKKPRWKYLHSQSGGTTKSGHSLDVVEASVGASKKRRTEAERPACQSPPTKMRTRNQRQSRYKERNHTDYGFHLDKHDRLSSPTAATEIQNQLVSIGESPLQSTQRASKDIGAPETCQPTHTEVLQSACKALQAELETLQKHEAELSKQHEDMKVQTRMACEREIEEIHKKYEAVLQNANTTFLEKKNDIETRHRKVHINKELVEGFLQKDFKSATLSRVATNFAVEQTMKLISGTHQGMMMQSSVEVPTASPDIQVAHSHQVDGWLRGPALHLRHSSLCTRVPQIPSEPPGLMYTPVILQQVASSVDAPQSQ